jgi:CRP-like cAMP-binding protein
MLETLFKKVAVFEGLPDEWVAELSSASEARSFEPNSIVFRKDDPCDGLYVVSQGGVVVRNEVVGQPIERVRALGPGDVFGETEALDAVPRQFSARTLGPTVVYRIPEEPLLEVLERHPEIEIALRAPMPRRRTARMHALMAPSSRMEPRIWVDRDVLLTLEDGERIGLRLENMSSGGVCLSPAPADWRVRRMLRFVLGTETRPELLRVSGAVRWRLGGSVGVAFDGAGPALRRRIHDALRELLPPVSGQPS